MSEAYLRNEIKEIVVYVFLGILTAIIIPLWIGFGALAFEESFRAGTALQFGSILVTFIIYFVFTLATFGLTIYPIASIIELKPNEHPATKSNPSIFRLFSVTYIFAPEQGLLYQLFEGIGLSGRRNPMRWSRNFLRVLYISIIVFWLVGILQIAFPALKAVGVPQLQVQQVTVASDVAFSSLVPGWSETMTILFLFFFFMGIVAYACAKLIKDQNAALIAYYSLGVVIACSVISLLWAALHRIVYGNSDVALFTTLIFGFLGTLMTLASGTFIPFWIWHIFNNVYAKLAVLVPANEDVIFVSLVGWIFFTISCVFFEVWLWKRRKRKRAELTGEPSSF